MVVPPPTGRKGFQLEVAEVFQDVTLAARDMAAVVEHRHLRIVNMCGGGRPLVVGVQYQLRIDETVFFLLRIQTVLLHALHAIATAAWPLADDIQKNSVGIEEQGDDLFNLFAKVVEIRRIETHVPEAGL